MTAFDTDILSDLLAGDPVYAARARAIDPAEQYVPVVVAAEILRGWLAAARQAESGRGRMSLDEAYRLFGWHLLELARYQSLPYTAAEDAQFRLWKAAKIRVGTNDLRIAAICVVHGATLVTRNARDYARIPGLTFDVWT